MGFFVAWRLYQVPPKWLSTKSSFLFSQRSSLLKIDLQPTSLSTTSRNIKLESYSVKFYLSSQPPLRPQFPRMDSLPYWMCFNILPKNSKRFSGSLHNRGGLLKAHLLLLAYHMRIMVVVLLGEILCLLTGP